jgi:acetyltransferase-like isoleucine patch superfamily enzyme
MRKLVRPYVAWKYGFKAFGEGAQWGKGLRLAKGQVAVGRYSYIGPESEFGSEVVIGDLVMISAGAVIFGDDHRYDDPELPSRLAFGAQAPPTFFEADAWVGRGCLIRAGVRLGRGCVVGAGSVVVRDVAPYTIVAGVPARVIKHRYDDEGCAKRDAMMFGASGTLA